MLRRIGVLASLAVFATMFAGVSSAQAASALGCTFTGLAGSLGDRQNGANGIPSIEKDLTDPNYQTAEDPWDSEFGTYYYEGPAVCSGSVGDVPVLPTDNITIESGGEYENKLCGTGRVHDLDGLETSVKKDGVVIAWPVGYEIPFVSGAGPLYIGPPNQSTHGKPIGGDWTGEGAVSIQPVSPDNCVTTDTNEFTVAGSFSAVSPAVRP